MDEFYNHHYLWGIERIYALLKAGKITQAEFEEITDTNYGG